MPFDFQSIVIYLIVAGTLFWLLRNLFRKKGCGKGCDCGVPVKRNPVIEKAIQKQHRSGTATKPKS